MSKHFFVQWDHDANDFQILEGPHEFPARSLSNAWWTSIANDKSREKKAQVTHLGNRDSAEFRAAANVIGTRVRPTGLFELGLPASLRVLDAIYVENSGEPAMREFERKLLDSDADAAFYWNTKESDTGEWSLVLRRSYLGELPNGVGSDIILHSSFSVGVITPRQNIIPPQIEWINQS